MTLKEIEADIRSRMKEDAQVTMIIYAPKWADALAAERERIEALIPSKGTAASEDSPGIPSSQVGVPQSKAERACGNCGHIEHFRCCECGHVQAERGKDG